MDICILYRAYTQASGCAKPLMCKSFAHYAQGYAQDSIYLNVMHTQFT